MGPSRVSGPLAVSLSIVALLLVPRAGFAVSAAPAASSKEARPLPRMFDARVNPTPETARALAARRAGSAAQRGEARQRMAATAAAVEQAAARRADLEVELSAVTGAPSSVVAKSGALTPPAPGLGSEEIVRGYLLRNASLYGLSAGDVEDFVALGDSAGGASGLRMLRMEQRIADRPVFQSETRFLLDSVGRLRKVVGLPFPGARRFAPVADSAWVLSPEEAVASLLAVSGAGADPKAFAVVDERDGLIELSESAAGVAGPVTARQVLFPLEPGVLVPAWSLVVFTEGEQDWYAVVDARTGALLWRKNIRNYASTHDAHFRVYVQADGVTPADNPAPASPTALTPGSGTQFPAISPSVVSMHAAMDPAASPNGWIDDCPVGGCTANETQTLGNNVLACLDRTVGGGTTNVCDTDANSVLDGNGRPTGNPDTNGRDRDFLGTAPRDFETNFLPPPQTTPADAEVGQTATGNGAAFDQFRRGAVTHLFYVSNWYHDQLFDLGFDEPSGNFQLANFQGLGGVAGDRVLADAQDGSGTNNANFATPPDGTSGRMQMFRFTGATVDRDGDLDSEIVIHELTHGTSNRLVGNAAGLNWDPAAGMGEGWSDFYALSMLNGTNADDPDGQYSSGGYSTYKLIGGFEDNYLYGIRRFPYSTDNGVNPLTWADVDDVTNDLSGGIATSPINFNGGGGLQVHNAGEIWMLSLWEVRSRVIADPAGAAGDVPTGNRTMLQLVTDALKMTPIDPTFVQGRDALFDADCATNACANEEWIWEGFAERGLGYGAATPFDVVFGYTAGHMGVTESFSLPYLDVADPSADVAIDDSAGNANGAIDPGEPVVLTVTLTNPWRAASRPVSGGTAVLSSATPGVTIFDDTAAFGAIAPAGSTAASDGFTIAVSDPATCGGSLDFTLTTTSDLGTTATTFRLRLGMANGTDPVVTYTSTPNLAIPDGRSLAVFDTLTVPDDLEIADLDLRVDSLTHSFTGDLSFMLRSPGGLGVDLISLIGGLVDGGPGNDLTDMVIDDDLVPGTGNDMVLAAGAQAPFTGSWVPVFNGVWPTFAGFPAGDPVGNLSRFDGLSTAGTWAAAVSDQFSIDSGTLVEWSMLVTPVHFDCTAFVGAADVSATKTVAGDLAVGGTVTYTVTLTNDGTAVQGDNPGDELVDVLPAELTLVSASATGGTAVANVGTNTVTWNGSLAPLGGGVTITIDATVDAGTEGATVSNQGTVSYDSGDDGTNDAATLTDDPGVGGPQDATSFTVGGVVLSATKTVSGDFSVGGTVVYTIVIANTGGSVQPDNPGDELVDILPPQLELVGASATSGTAVASVATNTVAWNGSVPAGGDVTITITATVGPGTEGDEILNQGTVFFDADLDGANESSLETDDPGAAGAADPTGFVVAGIDIAEIPTATETGLAILTILLMMAGWEIMRRRSAAI